MRLKNLVQEYKDKLINDPQQKREHYERAMKRLKDVVNAFSDMISEEEKIRLRKIYKQWQDELRKIK